MDARTIKLMDCVTGTSTNTEGLALSLVLLTELKDGNVVKLSLDGCTPMSSSFLNSSFGEVVEEVGMDVIKNQLRLVDYKPSEAKQIKDYLALVSSLVK
ncbi:STAS-like domain-containing protein [Rufibacter quisquiliarum]|uniref:DUF4325 domain-containing protein n=1 Tax=Rufibacter quisquiliarum TaxID=1549639 RepID=A0A839GM74_9BACT|nr:STAS-like domain-containing protein [Rufibacter quisquiliarum]MBA9076076.1 hypothetical protein [Rufibacter quisquiliarum]